MCITFILASLFSSSPMMGELLDDDYRFLRHPRHLEFTLLKTDYRESIDPSDGISTSKPESPTTPIKLPNEPVDTTISKETATPEAKTKKELSTSDTKVRTEQAAPKKKTTKKRPPTNKAPSPNTSPNVSEEVKVITPKAVEEPKLEEAPKGHLVNFPNVSMYELTRFISRVAKVNFIGNKKLLDFDVSFISGRASEPKDLLKILLKMFSQHGLEAEDLEGNYFFQTAQEKPLVEEKSDEDNEKELTNRIQKEGKFFVYKLQYHQGDEILNALKQIAPELQQTDLSETIATMQWIQSTNSLFFNGPKMGLKKVNDLIKSLDTALKQVFIEVLVIETNINNSLDFGLQWSASSKYKDRVGFGVGSLFPTNDNPLFSETMKSIGTTESPTGLNQLPVGNGFDLGVIGDIIFHKGKSFLTLGSLISALQTEGDCTIVLNQKIITQENKHSRIFVGDNIPFAGSVVQTIGSGQQTTANIEYRDIGVNLDIIPLLGNGEIITLDIQEEITEALDHPVHKTNQLSGIKTSKTNMTTSVHVPNGHFLILSGMTRNVKTKQKKGPPIIGSLPFIGSLFNKKESRNEKSNILIFVKPHIIRSHDDYIDLSNAIQEEVLPSTEKSTPESVVS